MLRPSHRRRPFGEIIRNAVVPPIVLVVAALCAWSARAEPSIETAAKQAILIDDTTGTVLFNKNADERMFPASMSKLMTLYIVFDHLKSGSLSLETAFRVSEKAWRMGGSKMFVEVNSRVAVNELLRGVIVQSGNDACIVLAEGIAGSEEAFAQMMNEYAEKLGMHHSHFVNATGWPNPDHVSTAHDLALLSHHIIHDFPQYYSLFDEKTYTYNGIKQGNRNPLLYTYSGADGLKTGHTEVSGYGLTASAKRDGRRLIVVVNGLADVNERAREGERLLDYGFREFANYHLFKAGDIVENVEVWLGDEPTVPVKVDEDVTLTLARKEREGLKVTVQAPGPVPAPVTKGTEVAKLVIEVPDKPPVEHPLLASEDVGKLSSLGRIGAAFNYLLWGEQER